MYEMRHVESKQLSCINDKITQVTSRFLSISLSGLNRYLSLLLSMINNRPKPQLVIQLLSHNLRKSIIRHAGSMAYVAKICISECFTVHEHFVKPCC